MTPLRERIRKGNKKGENHRQNNARANEMRLPGC